MDAWGLLFQIVVLLGACLAGGVLMARLGQSPLVGYLLVGMLLGGPGSVGLISAASNIEAIAEVGVALLLFSLGLEFSWQRLRQLGGKTLAAGWVQVGLTLAAGVVITLAFGLSIRAALAVGAMVALSSTAAVLRMLIEAAELDSQHGRASLAVLLVQDMAVVPLSVLLALLARGGTPGEVTLGVAKTVGLAALLVFTLYIVLNKIAVRALSAMSIERNREFAVLLAVVLGLGAAWGAHAAGISPALGAFIGGLFLGASPFATQVRADVSSLRVVLLTLFFGAVGMVADPVWIVGHLGLVLGVSTLVIAGKAGLVWVALRWMGKPTSVALATGLCLAQIGEFAFVLGKLGRDGGFVSHDLYMLIVSTAMVTLFVTPWLVRYAPRLGARLAEAGGSGAPPPDEGHAAFLPEIVIVGFGPSGQAVGRSLIGRGKRVLVLDLNADAAPLARSMGFESAIGDATSMEVLEHAGLRDARVVVIALPARSAARMVLDLVRGLCPRAHLIVRSRYALHVTEFREAGAHAVVGDEEEVGARMAEYVQLHLA
jgi:CPA2 family monovalent cation:H+ antiporter-2